MDVPSVTSEFSKMAVSQEQPVDRNNSSYDTAAAAAASASPDCASPGREQDSTAPNGTSETAPSAAAPGAPSSPRPRAISAYRKPTCIDATTDSRSESASTSDSGPTTPSKPLVSPLKATAAEFRPSPLAPAAGAPTSQNLGPLFEVRASARGGSGVFATRDISMGTRIICDSPLLKIPWNHLYLAWGPYCRLSNAQKQEYDTLYFWNNKDLNLEQASRLHLLDPTDDAVESDDEGEIINEHIRVMGIFAVNNFQMSEGALGIFANAARLNHSCVPNVHHSYNSSIDKLTVHAMRDIGKDEELLMNYIGSECHFWTHSQRWDYLRSKYGFTCQCEACSDTTGNSDNRHEAMRALIWGLEQFQKEEPKTHFVIPDSYTAAVVQAEDIISLLLEQDLLAVELTRAYRLASSIALGAGLYQKALEYASNEADVERNIFGNELDDLRKNGTASELWIKSLYGTLKYQGFNPYRRLAEKIFNLTDVYHEALDAPKRRDAFKKGASKEIICKQDSPKKSSWKKRQSPKKKALWSPEKQHDV